MPEKICTVEDCSKIAHAKNYCPMHYRRFRLYGDPEKFLIDRHGEGGTLEHTSWRHMKERCYYKKDLNYKRYGARGISVNDRWRNSFSEFLKDMGYKPSPEHQIDRIDNSGNYEPSNCRWVTIQENCQNRRSTKLNSKVVLDIRDEYENGSNTQELARKYNVVDSTIRRVIRRVTWSNI